MRSTKAWIAVAAVALTVGVGACSSGTKSSARPNTTATTQDAARTILGLTGQIQQAENTPNGPRALTRAEAQAIVDAQTKQLGIPASKP